MLDKALLREIRRQLRLTMRDMAVLMGYNSPCSYFRLEHGQSGGNVRQLRLLSEILGVSVEELMGISGVAALHATERGPIDDKSV